MPFIPSRFRAAALALALAAGPARSGFFDDRRFDILTDETFPADEYILEQARFWYAVYVEVGDDEGLLHDPFFPDLVFRKARAPGQGRAGSRLAADQVKSLQAEIRGFLAKDTSAWTPEEKALRARFPSYWDTTAIRLSCERIRFQRGLKTKYRAGLERSYRYLPMIDSVFAAAGVPARLRFLPHVESSFYPFAYSKVGAAGMWQFMKSSAKHYRMKVNYQIDERRDPHASTLAAARMLAYNHSLLKSWPLAISAYNHGPGGLANAARTTGTRDLSTIIKSYYSNTFGFASKNFYAEFLAASSIAMKADSIFPGLRKLEPLRFRHLVLQKPVATKFVCASTGLSPQELEEYNLALRPATFRGNGQLPKGFALRLPAEMDLAPLALRLGGVVPGAEMLAASGSGGAPAAAASAPGSAAPSAQAAAGQVAAASPAAPSAQAAAASAARAAAAPPVPAASTPIPQVAASSPAGQTAAAPAGSQAAAVLPAPASAAPVAAAGTGAQVVAMAAPPPVVPKRPPAPAPPGVVPSAVTDTSPPPPAEAGAEPDKSGNRVADANPLEPGKPRPRLRERLRARLAENRGEPEAKPQSVISAEPPPPSATVPGPKGPRPVAAAPAPAGAPVPQPQSAALAAAAPAPVAVPEPPRVIDSTLSLQASDLDKLAHPSDRFNPAVYPLQYEYRDGVLTFVAGPEETLSHYAEWAGIGESVVRRASRIRNPRDFRMGRGIKIPLPEDKAKEFMRRREENYRAMEEDFYSNYYVSTVEPFAVAKGQNLWTWAQDQEIPFWLLQKHNPGRELSGLHPGDTLNMPVIETGARKWGFTRYANAREYLDGVARFLATGKADP